MVSFAQCINRLLDKLHVEGLPPGTLLYNGHQRYKTLHNNSSGLLNHNNHTNGTPEPQNSVDLYECPSCHRRIPPTRFAAHLEKCMGISGRNVARQAAANILKVYVYLLME